MSIYVEVFEPVHSLEALIDELAWTTMVEAYKAPAAVHDTTDVTEGFYKEHVGPGTFTLSYLKDDLADDIIKFWPFPQKSRAKEPERTRFAGPTCGCGSRTYHYSDDYTHYVCWRCGKASDSASLEARPLRENRAKVRIKTAPECPECGAVSYDLHECLGCGADVSEAAISLREHLAYLDRLRSRPPAPAFRYASGTSQRASRVLKHGVPHRFVAVGEFGENPGFRYPRYPAEKLPDGTYKLQEPRLESNPTFEVAPRAAGRPIVVGIVRCPTTVTQGYVPGSGFVCGDPVTDYPDTVEELHRRWDDRQFLKRTLRSYETFPEGAKKRDVFSPTWARLPKAAEYSQKEEGSSRQEHYESPFAELARRLKLGDRPPERSLFKRRMILGMTQKELAEKAGIDPKTVYNYESGAHTASEKTVNKVKAVLEEEENSARGRSLEHDPARVWVKTKDGPVEMLRPCKPQPPHEGKRVLPTPSDKPVYRKPPTWARHLKIMPHRKADLIALGGKPADSNRRPAVIVGGSVVERDPRRLRPSHTAERGRSGLLYPPPRKPRKATSWEWEKMTHRPEREKVPEEPIPATFARWGTPLGGRQTANKVTAELQREGEPDWAELSQRMLEDLYTRITGKMVRFKRKPAPGKMMSGLAGIFSEKYLKGPEPPDPLTMHQCYLRRYSNIPEAGIVKDFSGSVALVEGTHSDAPEAA